MTILSVKFAIVSSRFASTLLCYIYSVLWILVKILTLGQGQTVLDVLNMTFPPSR